MPGPWERLRGDALPASLLQASVTESYRTDGHRPCPSWPAALLPPLLQRAGGPPGPRLLRPLLPPAPADSICRRHRSEPPRPHGLPRRTHGRGKSQGLARAGPPGHADHTVRDSSPPTWRPVPQHRLSCGGCGPLRAGDGVLPTLPPALRPPWPGQARAMAMGWGCSAALPGACWLWRKSPPPVPSLCLPPWPPR